MSIGDEVLDAIIEVADEYVGAEGNVELKGERAEFVKAVEDTLNDSGEIIDAEISDNLQTRVAIGLDSEELAALQLRADALNMSLTMYVKYAALRWLQS